MKKFQYKTFNDQLSEDELNKLGNEGWELVTHSVVNFIITIQYYVFKKEIK